MKKKMIKYSFLIDACDDNETNSTEKDQLKRLKNYFVSFSFL